MKKLFSKILAFSMVASMLSTAVFAEEMTDVDGVTLSDVTGVADYAIYLGNDGNELPVYSCEDYAVITLDQDVEWVSLYYYYYGQTQGVGPLTTDGGDGFVASFDCDITLADGTVMTLTELYEAFFAGEVTEDVKDGGYLLANGEITVLFDGIYVFEVYYLEDDSTDYFTFEVYDTDGVDSYVPSEEVAEEEIAEETTEEVTEEVAEETTEETTEEVATEEVAEEEIVEIVTGTAKAATATVIVDGEEIAFEAYEIDGNNYFKLRDLAAVTSGSEKQFEVTWDEELNAIGLISGQAYTEVGGELATGDGENKEYTSTTAAIYKDDVEVSFTAYEINDNNYFKLRDVCEAFDIGVTWDDETQTIGVDTSISYEE